MDLSAIKMKINSFQRYITAELINFQPDKQQNSTPSKEKNKIDI